ATILELSYVGSASFRTLRDRELNPGRVPATGYPYLNSLQSRRIYQRIGSIVSAESSGRARSDSFQVQIRRRFTHGLMFQASYVLSKALDNGGPRNGLAPNPFQWARSPFDRRHNGVLSFSYDIPQLGLRHTAELLAGWRVSGIIELRSGLPLNIFQLSDSTLSGSDPAGTSVPDLTGAFRQIDPRRSHSLIT